MTTVRQRNRVPRPVPVRSSGGLPAIEEAGEVLRRGSVSGSRFESRDCHEAASALLREVVDEATVGSEPDRVYEG